MPLTGVYSSFIAYVLGKFQTVVLQSMSEEDLISASHRNYDYSEIRTTY